jgi:hypothetical protein
VSEEPEPSAEKTTKRKKITTGKVKKENFDDGANGYDTNLTDDAAHNQTNLPDTPVSHTETAAANGGCLAGFEPEAEVEAKSIFGNSRVEPEAEVKAEVTNDDFFGMI